MSLDSRPSVPAWLSGTTTTEHVGFCRAVSAMLTLQLSQGPSATASSAQRQTFLNSESGIKYMPWTQGTTGQKFQDHLNSFKRNWKSRWAPPTDPLPLAQSHCRVLHLCAEVPTARWLLNRSTIVCRRHHWKADLTATLYSLKVSTT